jgi:hypothetical protein
MSPTLPPARSIYVSTSLEIWEPSQPDLLARDVTLDGVCFLRLDPEYYAWLRHKLSIAGKALDAGKIAYDKYGIMLARFNEVHMLAVDRFGRDNLGAAMESLNYRDYTPPGAVASRTATKPARQDQPAPMNPPAEPYLYPSHGEWPFTHKIPTSAMAKVDSIREQALSLGWKEPRLYQNRGRFPFPCGQDYGLACFVDGENRIGEVAAQYIEIIGPPPQGSCQRFFNPDVDQPWIKRTESEIARKG